MESFDLAARVRALYAIVNELESQYGRSFTLDGHLVGSIGEVIAAEFYGLTLFENAHPIHDAVTEDGRNVQIKMTQGDRVALSSEPDYLIVMTIDKQGSWQEVYNGEGARVWNCVKDRTLPKNGQRPISVGRLKKLAKEAAPEERIVRKG